MNKVLIVSVFVLCSIGFCSPGMPGRKPPRRLYNGHDCPLGSIKHILIDCNFCACHRGHIVNCTHYVCSNDGFILTTEEHTCIDAEVKFDNCSTCMCRNDTWHCTEPRCRNTTRSKRAFWESLCKFKDAKSQEEDCVGCRSTRTPKKSCVPADGDVEYIQFFADDLKDMSCAPNDKLYLDCLLCTCNANSTGYNCTTAEDCNENEPLDMRVNSAKIYIDNQLNNNLLSL